MNITKKITMLTLAILIVSATSFLARRGGGGTRGGGRGGGMSGGGMSSGGKGGGQKSGGMQDKTKGMSNPVNLWLDINLNKVNDD